MNYGLLNPKEIQTFRLIQENHRITQFGLDRKDTSITKPLNILFFLQKGIFEIIKLMECFKNYGGAGRSILNVI